MPCKGKVFGITLWPRKGWKKRKIVEPIAGGSLGSPYEKGE